MSVDKTKFKLSASQRLKKPSQFQSVYQSKQWGGSKYFTFNVLANDQAILKNSQRPAVLGVTVSKKVSKRAVDRNRIKRQIREFFRHQQNDLHNADIVITAKPHCIKANDEDRQASLIELWTKVLKWQRWHQRQLAKKQDITN